MATVAQSRTAQQAVAAGAQLAVFAALSVVADLGPIGWAAGLGYEVGLFPLVNTAARRARITALGAANLVTLARALLVGGVTALVADALWTGRTAVAPLVVLSAVALVLDGVDGRVARRSGTVSALGARFDMETDSFLLLVLSVHVAVLLGPWVLVIGVLRYGFVAAGWLAPWLRSPLPARYSAKVVAALQGITLTAASTGLLPHPVAVAVVAAGLVALVWSFGRDVWWLWCAGRPR